MLASTRLLPLVLMTCFFWVGENAGSFENIGMFGDILRLGIDCRSDTGRISFPIGRIHATIYGVGSTSHIFSMAGLRSTSTGGALRIAAIR